MLTSFTHEQLLSICKVLGDTQRGLTNSEIEQLLRSAVIDDPSSRTNTGPYFYSAISKKDRLFQALSRRQSQDRCGNNVANFIQIAMSPVRYVNNKERFDFLRDELNKVLSFSGLFLGDDAKLRVAERAETISEAEKRASRLRAKLVERNAHPEVLAFCRAELMQDNYFHAVLEATKSVAEKIRTKTALGADGSVLVDEAFAFGKDGIPRLGFNSLKTETEKDEQRGLVNLLKGMFGTFRNVTAHAPKVTWEIDEQDALDLLSLASFLHRRIDQARPLNQS